MLHLKMEIIQVMPSMFCHYGSLCQRLRMGKVWSSTRQMLLVDWSWLTVLYRVRAKDVCKPGRIRNRWQFKLLSLYLCQESFPLSLIHQVSSASDIYISMVSACLNVKVTQYSFVSSYYYKTGMNWMFLLLFSWTVSPSCLRLEALWDLK